MDQMQPADATDFIRRLKSPRREAQQDIAQDQQETSRKTLACMVTHGMGQQVRFETAALIAEALQRNGNHQPTSIKPDRVQLTQDGDLLSCMKMIFPAYGDEPETEVHIFEGYWAPLTEGRISLTQTLIFLWSAFLRGVKTTLKKTRKDDGSSARRIFTRWTFGKMRAYAIKPRTLSLLLWIGLALFLGVALAWWSEESLRAAYSAIKHVWQHAPSVCLCSDWHGSSLNAYLMQLKAMLIALWTKVEGSPCKFILGILGPILGGFFVYFFRYALVEYVGDVAIYVSSFEVSAFEEIRNAIQKAVLHVGKQIVAATNPPSALTDFPGTARQQKYDGLIFVGHSLGSVITYDLVNALIVWDATCCNNEYGVVNRITRMITFGSPLDKTAFLFRTQTTKDHHYREAMAAQMQPMILDYSFRPFPWTNIYSRKDIVSGSLAYYDPEESTTLGERVKNIADPDAKWPILAHTEYWEHKILTDQLLKAIERG